MTDEDDVHYHLPGAYLPLCGEDPYAEEDTSSTDEGGTGTCPACRAAADEEPLR